MPRTIEPILGLDWTSHRTPPPAVADAHDHIRSPDVIVVFGTDDSKGYAIAYFNKGWGDDDDTEPRWTDSGSESWTLTNVIAWKYIIGPATLEGLR